VRQALNLTDAELFGATALRSSACTLPRRQGGSKIQLAHVGSSVVFHWPEASF
jgi:hypothetical protein